MKIIDKVLVSSINYFQDPDNYDQHLYKLGKGYSEFIVVNPIFDTSILKFLDTTLTSDSVIVWKSKDLWIAKKFQKNWSPISGWTVIEQHGWPMKVVFNHDLPKFFDIDKFSKSIQNQKLDPLYEYIWYLNTNYFSKDKIWVYKYGIENLELPKKDMGMIDPDHDLTINWVSNPRLPSSVKFENDPRQHFNYNIWDLNFERVWYINSKYSNTGKIWALKSKIKSKDKLDVKNMGQLEVILPEKLDVFFISYDEPEAEQNWKRLLEIVPYAKRVHGVKGIFEAHYMAAIQSKTDMFFVVDGDSWISKDFNFLFQPNLFDRDCTHIWISHNEIVNETYGHGGVKLLNRQTILDYNPNDELDFSTSFTKKIKVIKTVGSYHRFASSRFHSWKGAFRETIKLLQKTPDLETDSRLKSWRSIKIVDQYTEFAVYGVRDAEIFVEHKLNPHLINDIDWITNFFKKKYESK
jgi:hypothetical protein